MELPNTNRAFFKVTYAPIDLGKNRDDPNLRLKKANAIQAFAPTLTELKELGKAPTSQPSDKLSKAAHLFVSSLSDFPSKHASSSGLAKSLSDVTTTEILNLGRSLVKLRSQSNEKPLEQSFDQPQALALNNVIPQSALATSGNVKLFEHVFAVSESRGVSPVGRLHLERVDMIPAGIERGELIGTVPLAPKETVTILHKETSTITKEFQSILNDEYENSGDVQSTEKSELAQSTDYQTKHSAALGLNAEIGSGAGPKIITTYKASSKLDLKTEDAETRKDSRNHTESLTKKASFRTKQEHKITISMTSVVGKEDMTTRTVTNPNDANGMRLDYFSMMRKWHVQLYRYGIRMTYDLVIPEPGATFRHIYNQINQIDLDLAKPFDFQLKIEDINSDNQGDPNYYTKLSVQYNTPLPTAPPKTMPTFTIPGVASVDNPSDGGLHVFTLEFDLPDNYYVTGAHLHADLGNSTWGGRRLVFYGGPWDLINPTDAAVLDVEMLWLHGAYGHQKLQYMIRNMGIIAFGISIQVSIKKEVFQSWQAQCWSALRAAALNSYNATVQLLQQQRKELIDQAYAGDTLSLRRQEHEEIMKAVLRWLFGPSFELMPYQINMIGKLGLLPRPRPDDFEPLGQISDPSNLVKVPSLARSSWKIILDHGEVIKFLNEAIEWENLLYFLYPYFWDLPGDWDDIKKISHPDPDRNDFLRAGSARVVVTIRPGFEAEFAKKLVEGAFSDPLPEDMPYESIAGDIQTYANTTYPGIPPANPGGGSLPDPNPIVATSVAKITASESPVNIPVDSSDKFRAGYMAVIDTSVSKVQESHLIIAVPDGTHITVQKLTNSHDGTQSAFPIVQSTEKGILIAEWFEYTPTSGIDIGVISIPPSTQVSDMA